MPLHSIPHYSTKISSESNPVPQRGSPSSPIATMIQSQMLMATVERGQAEVSSKMAAMDAHHPMCTHIRGACLVLVALTKAIEDNEKILDSVVGSVQEEIVPTLSDIPDVLKAKLMEMVHVLKSEEVRKSSPGIM